MENLPNEILLLIIKQLPTQDRWLLRKTSRRLRDSVDSEGILPTDPFTIKIDFEKQVIVLSCHGKNKTHFQCAVVNGTVRGNRWRGAKGMSPHLYRRFRYFCDVGNNWGKHVQMYLDELNKNYSQRKMCCNIEVTLSQDEDADRFSNFSVTFDEIFIQPPPKKPCKMLFTRLPNVLNTWMAGLLQPYFIQLYYVLSPSHLDRITSKRLTCLLDDEGAVHIMEKFASKTLPLLKCWIFHIERNSTRLLHLLSTQYGLDAEIMESMSSSPLRLGCGSYSINIHRKSKFDNELLMIIR